VTPESIFCNRCGSSSAGDAQFCQRCGTSLAIPQGSTIAVAQSANSHYAGFWVRVLAATADVFLLFAVAWPVRLLVGSAIVDAGMRIRMSTHQILMGRRLILIALGLAIGWVYRAGMESSRHQATLGKMAMRLKVVDLGGRRLSLGRATARHFSKFLSLLSFGIGYLMVGFDEQKRSLHDLIAGTLVIRRERGGD
jgi:uncharacterized RDD family membrane protein YckC